MNFKMIDNLYPKGPQLEDLSILKPSPNFKRSVYLVISSILLFFIFYLILLAISIALLVGCTYAGITLIPILSYITLVVGLGLIVLGIMFFLFLIKFIFSKTKDENPYRTEIKEADQPILFQFIKKLSEETKTKLPKKIFLSPDVNASVFYNSSFWSLFFPVRKNLEIGLGLVNSLNISEFKAVIAHEFAHFSQRSLKVGVYIYTVNRAIYNLVYEYDQWDKLLSTWAESGGIFGFFAGITFWLVERVRSLLKIAYNLININYLKLSREMEFNADLIAASIAGNKHVISALQKTEFIAFAYESTLSILTILAEQGKSSSNVYNNHSYLMSYLGNLFNLTMVDGQPVITDEDIERHVIKSRINIKDQWASHPSLNEREYNLSKIDIDSEINTMSAWKVFNHFDELQSETTKKLYQIGFPEKEFTSINETEFESYVLAEEEKYNISSKYNGFYDDRYIQEFDMDELVKGDLNDEELTFEQIYSKENVEKIKRYLSNKSDLELLDQIATGKVKAKYFEFDAKKYRKKDAKKLIEDLNRDLLIQENWLSELDQKSFLLNFRLAKQSESEHLYLEKLNNVIALQKSMKEVNELVSKYQDFSYQLYSKPRWTEIEIKHLVAKLSDFEGEFKTYLKSTNIESLKANLLSEEQKSVLNDYVTSNSFYIKLSEFDEESFIKLSDLAYNVSSSVGISYGKSLKELTEFQLELNKQK